MNETKLVSMRDCLGSKCEKCQDRNCLWYYLTGHILGKKIKKEDKE